MDRERTFLADSPKFACGTVARACAGLDRRRPQLRKHAQVAVQQAGAVLGHGRVPYNAVPATVRAAHRAERAGHGAAQSVASKGQPGQLGQGAAWRAREAWAANMVPKAPRRRQLRG